MHWYQMHLVLVTHLVDEKQMMTCAETACETSCHGRTQPQPHMLFKLHESLLTLPAQLA